MKIHSGIILWSGLSLTLAGVLLFLLIHATSTKRTAQEELAETKGQKVVYSLEQEKIISKPFDPSSLQGDAKPTPSSDATDGEEKSPPMPAAALQLKKDGKPKIVIIVGGLGQSSSHTERALQLPSIVTLGISAYSPEAKKWEELATKDKHEVLVRIPMEPINYPEDDDGSFELLSGLSDTENMARLGITLAKLNHFVGTYTDHNERFTLFMKKLRPILDSMKARNLLFVYGGNSQNTMLEQLATSDSLPIVVSNLQLDQDIVATSITEKLNELEKIARTNGFAIGIAERPYPVTVKLIENWLTTTESKGLQVVPISGLFTNFRNSARAEKPAQH